MPKLRRDKYYGLKINYSLPMIFREYGIIIYYYFIQTKSNYTIRSIITGEEEIRIQTAIVILVRLLLERVDQQLPPL